MIEPEFQRWQHTFTLYRRALSLVIEAVELAQARELSELEKAGLIQRFETAWEMGWKALADYLREHEDPQLNRTPGSTIRLGRAAGLIDDGDAWLAAGKLRNILSHEYSLAQRDEGLRLITVRFMPLMIALQARLEERGAN